MNLHVTTTPAPPQTICRLSTATIVQVQPPNTASTMLQPFSQTSSVLGRSSEPSTSISISPSPCKLRSLHSPLHSNHYSFRLNFSNTFRFTDISYLHKSILSEVGVFLGFKPKIHCKVASLPKKKTSKNSKGKYFKSGGNLSSVLRMLDSEGVDVGKALDSYRMLTPREQTSILNSQKNWRKALRVFEWFKSQPGYVPNGIHYNVVLRTLGIARRWDELRLCWIDMVKSGVVPTNYTYSIVVDVCGKAGLVREGLLWIKHMKSRGIYPDEVTMSTVIKLLKDAEEYDRADKFYNDWRVGRIELDNLDLDRGDAKCSTLKQFLSAELLRTTGRMSTSIDLNVWFAESSVGKLRLTTTYNQLIDLYAKAGRIEEAADWVSEMINSGVALDAFTFNTMIHICGKCGSLTEAEALLEIMDERGISPNTDTYNTFMCLYANVGDIEAALGCFRKIRKVGHFPDEVTFNTVLSIICERNMVQELEAVLKEMEEMEIRVDQSFLLVLVQMLVNEGLTERAKFLVESSQSYYVLTSKRRAAIIDIYAEKGLYAEAESLFYSKSNDGEQKDVLEYNVMIKAYGRAKLYDVAVSLFSSMKDQGTWPDACTYNSLIQMLASGNSVDKARTLVAEMQESGFKPSCQTFTAVAAGLIKNGRLHDAVEVVQEMSRSDVKPNEVVFGLLIDAFAKAGNFEEAIHYFKAMEDYGISANQRILTSMIKAYGEIRLLEGAKQLYDKLKFFDGGPDSMASNSMLKLYADLGTVSEAKEMYDDLRFKKCADVVTFTTMMNVYKRRGMLDEAIEVAEEMKKSGVVKDCRAFTVEMACYAAKRQFLECGELLHEMVEDQKLSPDEETLKVLFTILEMTGYPREAMRNLMSISQREGIKLSTDAVIASVFSMVGLHNYADKASRSFNRQNPTLFSVRYNALIRSLVDRGKTKEAQVLYMHMEDYGLKPDVVTFIELARVHGKDGDVDGVKTVHSILMSGEFEPDEALYKAIVDAYEDVDRPDLAYFVRKEMLRFVHKDTDTETANKTEEEHEEDEYKEEYEEDEYKEEYEEDDEYEDEYEEDDEYEDEYETV